MYCWQLKPVSEMTLEHAIPQCLAGAQAPIRFKVRSACRNCNSSLGRYVDARFEKSFLTSIALAEAARFLAETDASVIPPLVCIGTVALEIPRMLDTELCEWWMGSQGEHVVLIRPAAENFHGYQGGNPIAMKQLSANARAYFFFNETAEHHRSLAEFKASFKRRKVRKISATEVEGIALKDYGFSAPDSADMAAIEYLWKNVMSGNGIKGAVPFSGDFDTRFMCKIALAVGYCEFGEEYLESAFAKKLFRGLWYDGDGEAPEIPGARPFNSPADELLKSFSCDPGAVSLLTMSSNELLLLTLNIHQKHTWTMGIAKKSELPNQEFERFKDGKLLMLFGPAHRFYEIDFPNILLGSYIQTIKRREKALLRRRRESRPIFRR
jgi:hypothetical protein